MYLQCNANLKVYLERGEILILIDALVEIFFQCFVIPIFHRAPPAYKALHSVVLLHCIKQKLTRNKMVVTSTRRGNKTTKRLILRNVLSYKIVVTDVLCYWCSFNECTLICLPCYIC